MLGMIRGHSLCRGHGRSPATNQLYVQHFSRFVGRNDVAREKIYKTTNLKVKAISAVFAGAILLFCMAISFPQFDRTREEK